MNGASGYGLRDAMGDRAGGRMDGSGKGTGLLALPLFYAPAAPEFGDPPLAALPSFFLRNICNSG
jgi:hypothetical protein